LHAVFAIALTLIALYFFMREERQLESTSLIVLLTILVWFELFEIHFRGERVRAEDFISGFGNESLIAICALMILTKGLERTGALQPIGHALARLWGVQPQLAFLLTLLTAATLSMFLNNTPVVAAILPLLVAVSLQARVSPSGILMPVGFATIIGGMSTTIGTSTNLLVTSIAADLGMRPLRMFDFAVPVFIVGSLALLYLWLLAPRLLPERSPPMSDVAPRVFTAQLRIEDGGYAADKSLAEALAQVHGRMKVTQIARGPLNLVRMPSVMLRADDRLLVNDTPERLKEYERLLGATLLADDTGQHVDPSHPLKSDQHLAEIVVTHDSALCQGSLEPARLLSAFDIAALALHRPSKRGGRMDLAEILLQPGDILLVQGTPDSLERLKRTGKALVLDGRVDLPRTSRASIGLGIMIGVVTTAALGWMPISMASLCGLGLMLATRCLTWKDALGALDRKIILVIVASLALGLSLTVAGATEHIATLYVALTGQLPVAIVLAGFILIFALLTEIVTNNAIAVLGTPIAMSVAQQLGVPAEPFVLGVLYGANMSYMTPVGYQTNLLVMSAGGYRFSDFFRAGLPLQLIMWIGLSIALPVVYGL
jgi:di/tricarboxylate transporter